MGLRTAASVSSSSNATDMAPALTEPISQDKLSSLPASEAGVSPRPGILVNNGQYLFSAKSNRESLYNRDGFQLAFIRKISNGPSIGPSSVVTHMDQNNDIENNHHQQQQQQTNYIKIDSSQQPQQQLEQEQDQQQQQQNQINITTTPTNTNNNMGLQKDFLKDTNDTMDQMLGDLAATSDLELMQVFKSFSAPTGGDNLCDLAGGLALFNDVDVMNIGLEDVTTPIKEPDTQEIRNEIEKRHIQMQRKCDFLIRRLRKIQASTMGIHLNEEINGLFEYTQKLLKRKDRESKSISTMTPLSQLQNEKQKQLSSYSLKSLVKRIDRVAIEQQCPTDKTTKGASNSTITKANAIAVSVHPSGFIPTLDAPETKILNQTTGLITSEFKLIRSVLDSDATASSSGGESADEMIVHSNVTQAPLTM